MTHAQKAEAVKPFRIRAGIVVDAESARVLVCSPDGVCTFYSERKLDRIPITFICPKCGRDELRMDYATPAQCGLVDK